VTRAFLGIALFEAGWLACVLGAAAGLPWLGTAIGAAFLLLILAMARRPARAALFVLLAGFAGPLADLAQVALGTLRLREPLLLGVWVPGWLWMLWLLFAASLCASLRWLSGRYVLAALAGAVAAPLSYLAGAKLGAAGLHPDLWPSLGALALAWLLLTPGLLRLAEWTAGEQHWPRRGETPGGGIP
jgi:hypothetical protein